MGNTAGAGLAEPQGRRRDARGARQNDGGVVAKTENGEAGKQTGGGEDDEKRPCSRKTNAGPDDDTWTIVRLPRYKMKKKHWRRFAKYSPLISATLAPMSTLMDIPALTQRWYSKDGVAQSDPRASLVLSAVGLALNVNANVLLVVRFSSKAPYWVHRSTKWSLGFWLGKTIVAGVNLMIFGILTRNQSDYSYLEGFWCAVVSLVISGIICFSLLFHYFLAFGRSQSDTSEVRNEGRRFMLSVTAFVGILAVQSLVFSQLEGWDYVSGVYMAVQTALTIGYGDYVPTTAAGKVLIFPFAVLTISHLGNEIALIVGFFTKRADERKEKWKLKFEGEMHRQANAVRPRANLMEEMALIHQINSREEMMNQVYDLLWSALALIVFWAVGAAAFSQIEGWSYGNAIYMCVILSLTIGFGDFTPVQPGGKVTFIVYALSAVPIVTSFAVQTITGLLSTFSERGVLREAFIIEQKRAPEAFAPHSDYVRQYRLWYEQLLGKSTATVDKDEVARDGAGEGDNGRPGEQADGDGNADVDADGRGNLQADALDQNSDEELEEDFARVERIEEQKIQLAQQSSASRDADSSTSSFAAGLDVNKNKVDDNRDVQPSSPETLTMPADERQLERDLLRQLLNRVVQLEAESRQMLLDSMHKGVARTLLLADRNVQIRDVQKLRNDNVNGLPISTGDAPPDHTSGPSKSPFPVMAGPASSEPDPGPPDSSPDMLSRIRRYRNTFAEILVLGSILQRLEGAEQNEFERWRDYDAEDEEGGGGDPEEAEDMRLGEDGVVRGRAEDLNELAGERWKGLTGKMFKRRAEKLRDKGLKVPVVDPEREQL